MTPVQQGWVHRLTAKGRCKKHNESCKNKPGEDPIMMYTAIFLAKNITKDDT